MQGMSDLKRRDVLVGLAAIAGAGAVEGQGGAVVAGSGTLGRSRVLAPTMAKMANGAERWTGPAGTLDTGEVVSLHESGMAAGGSASPMHKIAHSEVIVVLEGTLEFFHDGVTERVETGSAIYVGYGTEHSVKNVGEGRARHFVVQMGGDTKRA